MATRRRYPAGDEKKVLKRRFKSHLTTSKLLTGISLRLWILPLHSTKGLSWALYCSTLCLHVCLLLTRQWSLDTFAQVLASVRFSYSNPKVTGSPLTCAVCMHWSTKQAQLGISGNEKSAVNEVTFSKTSQYALYSAKKGEEAKKLELGTPHR
ncbi:unnamed protein product [Caretta caretta]